MIYCFIKDKPFHFDLDSFRFHPGPEFPSADVEIIRTDDQGYPYLSSSFYSYDSLIKWGFTWHPLPPELEILYHTQAYTALRQQLTRLHAP